MIIKRVSIISITVIFFLSISYAYTEGFSGAYTLKKGESLFGVIQNYTIQDDRETLIDLSFRYDLGYNEIVDANPGIDPWYPKKGTRVIIPTRWILPEYPSELLEKNKKLLVINLAELRLFLIHDKGDHLQVITFPLGIGREGFDTPTGIFSIIEKIKDPVWNIPKSIRDDYPELPLSVPPGPDNPLGKYALRLSNPSYLIHGTNKPLGVGRRVSHGCIRMYPEDIKSLFNLVTVGDKVYITYQSVKVTSDHGGIFIEVHRSFKKETSQLQEAIKQLISTGLIRSLNTRDLYRALADKRGIPRLLVKFSKN
ncbi:MAG: L,D-transpeptidase family protein [Nitrospirae bacterium]|nr:L,D-transpeptidase family protein [Nitrospirota bacterium]